MEDLVLNHVLAPRMSGAVKPEEEPLPTAIVAPVPTQEEPQPKSDVETQHAPKNEPITILIPRSATPPQRPSSPVPRSTSRVPRSASPMLQPESPLPRPESPLASLGRLGLVRGQRDALQTELKGQQSATLEAKKSVASLRKLALRLAVKIAVKEGQIASHAKALSRARMSLYMTQSTDKSLSPPRAPFYREGDLPLSPPLSPHASHLSPVPSATTWNHTGRTVGVTSSPKRSTSSVIGSDAGDKMSVMELSRADLKRDLEETQRKLAHLFESQALLRERYNKEKSKNQRLGAEVQQTQARVSTLEETTQQLEEEAACLHQYVESLEHANRILRDEMADAKLVKKNAEANLSKLQSSKLTLEHQLQAALDSKDVLELRLSDLQRSGNEVKGQLEESVGKQENQAKTLGDAVSTLEAQKTQLEDDVRMVKLQLSAASDLADELRSKLADMEDREVGLEHDLQESKETVAKLEEQLMTAYSKLSEMDTSVDELTAKLELSRAAKEDKTQVALLAKTSKERIGSNLRAAEKSRARVQKRLRATKADLMLYKNQLMANDSEIKELQDDLARAHRRNHELEVLVGEAEHTVKAVVEKTNASIEHITAIAADARFRSFSDYFKDEESSSQTSSVLEEQLNALQKEIDVLHQTNAALVTKLAAATDELDELKAIRRSPRGEVRVGNGGSASKGNINKPLPTPDSSELVAVEALYDSEVRQLQETRATFDRVVKTLQEKSAELDTLEKHGDGTTANALSGSATPRTITPEMLAEDAREDARAGQVQTKQPRVVSPEEGALAPGFAGPARRPRIQSVAVDIETTSQMAEFVEMPPMPPMPPIRKPPPVPIDTGLSSFSQVTRHRSHSETNLKTIDSVIEDRSFWRVGDISTIAAAAETGRRSSATPLFRSGQRSMSLSDDIFRQRKDSPMDPEDCPPLPRWPRSPPIFAPKATAAPWMNFEGQASQAVLARDLSPLASPRRSRWSLASLVASSAALPSPVSSSPKMFHKHFPPVHSHVVHKELPSLPTTALDKELPTTALDKELPSLPGQSGSLFHRVSHMKFGETVDRRSRTMDDLPSPRQMLSLFPPKTNSLDEQRPHSSSSYRPFNAELREPPSSHPLTLIPSSSTKSTAERQQSAADPDSIGLAITRDASPEPMSAFCSPRRLRLKRSLSKLKLPLKRSMAPQPADTTPPLPRQYKGLSKFIRSAKSHPTEAKQVPPRPQAINTGVTQMQDAPDITVMAPLPSPSYQVVPRSPVGLYDPVSKMWLTPHKRKSSTFGVLDPQSGEWLLPAPRADSLTASETTVALASAAKLNRASRADLMYLARMAERDAGIRFDDAEEEDEEDFDCSDTEPDCALSLAEKLEIIRSPSDRKRVLNVVSVSRKSSLRPPSEDRQRLPVGHERADRMPDMQGELEADQRLPSVLRISLAVAEDEEVEASDLESDHEDAVKKEATVDDAGENGVIMTRTFERNVSKVEAAEADPTNDRIARDATQEGMIGPQLGRVDIGKVDTASVNSADGKIARDGAGDRKAVKGDVTEVEDGDVVHASRASENKVEGMKDEADEIRDAKDGDSNTEIVANAAKEAPSIIDVAEEDVTEATPAEDDAKAPSSTKQSNTTRAADELGPRLAHPNEVAQSSSGNHHADTPADAAKVAAGPGVSEITKAESAHSSSSGGSGAVSAREALRSHPIFARGRTTPSPAPGQHEEWEKAGHQWRERLKHLKALRKPGAETGGKTIS